MKLSIQRFSLPAQWKQPGSIIRMLDPNPLGDWVRYEEVLRLLDQALSELQKPMTPKVQCDKRIEDRSSHGIRVSYCMRENGHEGGCE